MFQINIVILVCIFFISILVSVKASDYKYNHTEEKNHVHSTITNLLSNKEIIFMGDSLTRYQYLNFIGFLHTGQWVSRHPHVDLEKIWGDDWTRYLKVSTLRFGGYEICDCYRHPDKPLTTEYTKEQLQGNFVPGMKENRHYLDPVYNISVKFFFFTGFPFFVNKFPTTTDFFNIDVSSDWWLFDSFSVPTYDFRYDKLHPFLSDHIKPRVPDVLLFNMGTWLESPCKAEMNKDPKSFVETLKMAAKIPIWKTTTAYFTSVQQKEPYEFHSEVDNLETLDTIRNGNVTVFDAYQITRPLSFDKKNYDDNFHFQPHVYTLLNKHFLSLLDKIL